MLIFTKSGVTTMEYRPSPRFVFRGGSNSPPATPERMLVRVGTPVSVCSPLVRIESPISVIERHYSGARSIERSFERSKRMEAIPSLQTETSDAATNTPPRVDRSEQQVATNTPPRSEQQVVNHPPDLNGLRLRYSLFMNPDITPTKQSNRFSNSPSSATGSPLADDYSNSCSSSPFPSTSCASPVHQTRQVAPRLSEPMKPSRGSIF